MLRNRYYLGFISHDGIEYPGRHEPLVSPEIFEEVQRVFDTKHTSGERQRVHHHYLKGTVWCGPCHDQGRESRMIVQRAVGRSGGEYFYFFCRGRQGHTCSVPYIDFDRIEESVLRHYAKIHFTADLAARVRTILQETLSDGDKSRRLLRHQLLVEVARIERQEENLLDLAADAAMPKEKLRARILRLQHDKEQLAEQLSRVDDRLEVGAALLEAALTLLENPQELYRQSGQQQRRLLNQALFVKVYVDSKDVTGQELAEPFAELVETQRWYDEVGGDNEKDPLDHFPEGRATKVGLLTTAISGRGSSKPAMVEVMGLEPTTSTLRT